MATIAELNVEIGAELSKLDQGLKRATSSVKDFGGDVDRANNNMGRGADNAAKSYTSLGNIVKGVGVAMAAAFSVDAILSIGRDIVNTTANFQKMEAVLTNTLGSQSAAQNAMLMIQDLAASTPFAVDQLTDSYVKLANRGITPTAAEITKLGDLAASTGKDFDQLTEGLLDAMTGEFERLKEFGITASSQGDKVKFTFKGVTTEVAKTDQAIKAYVLSLGDAEGVSGAMAGISGTLGGKISNLGDTFTSLFKTIGEGNSGIMATFVDITQKAVEGLRQAIASNEQLAKEGASGAVSSYSEKTQAEFKAIAASAKEAGADVKEWLGDAFTAQKQPLETSLQKISAEISRVNAQLASPAIANNPMMSGDLNAELLKLMTAFETVKGKLDGLNDAYQKVGATALESTQGQVAAMGILAGLQKQLGDLQEDQANATSSSQIEDYNAQIAAKEAEIKKYLELGDAQRKQKQTLVDLNQELALTKLYSSALGESYDYVGQRIGILEGGIKELVEAGFKPGSSAVQNFRAELEMLKAFDMRGGALELLPTTLDQITASLNQAKNGMQGFQPTAVDMPSTQEVDPLSDAEARAVEFAERMYATGQALSEALYGLQVEGLTLFGETLGDLFSGSFSGMESFFRGILGVVAEFMGQFGQQLIALGVAKMSLDTLFSNPFAAIAAGVALVALSKVVSNVSSKGTSSMGGRGGSSYTPPTRNGGTYSSAGTQALNVGGEIRLAGADILIAINRAQEQGRRTG